jgi:peptidoglycan biosynthesis protein MviN/MurJ (putative lipid II flippase)
METAKGTGSPTRSAVGRGLVTALGTAAVSVGAAVAGAVLAREFGRTAETDGLFAAYAVYLVLALAAQASRLVVLPRLTRAVDGERLGAELAADSLAVGVLAVPVLAVGVGAPDWAAGLLTSSEVARESAADALPWMVVAAVGQLYAALAASALAARDSYGVAAFAYALGAGAGLAYFLVELERGPIALAVGLLVNAAITFAIPALAVVLQGGLRLSTVENLGGRVWELVRGTALPFSLQVLYVVAVRFAGELGVGAQTTLSYAYFIAAFLVAVTASSLALVSSAPLARSGLGGLRAATHVVSTSWVSLTIVAAAAGVFVLAGEPLVRAFLGDAFEGEAGVELGRLVAYLGPWMVASIGVSVTFPLLFVAGRERLLPALALAAVGVQIPLEWGFQELWGLEGVAVGLALTTLAIVGALLALLSRETLARAAAGLGALTLLSGSLAAASFGLAALVLGGVAAAVVGAAVYSAALLLWRPRGLRAAWAYVRALT